MLPQHPFQTAPFFLPWNGLPIPVSFCLRLSLVIVAASALTAGAPIAGAPTAGALTAEAHTAVAPAIGAPTQPRAERKVTWAEAGAEVRAEYLGRDTT